MGRIQLRGISSRDGAWGSTDGELEAAVNVGAEDWGLTPLAPPSLLFEDVESDAAICMHTPGNFRHYIIASGENAVSVEIRTPEGAVKQQLAINYRGKVQEALPMGNIVVFSGDSGQYYLLWDGEKGSYRTLGSELPTASMRFRLRGSLVRRDFEASDLKLIDGSGTQTKDEASWQILYSHFFDEISYKDNATDGADGYAGGLSLYNLIFTKGKEYRVSVKNLNVKDGSGSSLYAILCYDNKELVTVYDRKTFTADTAYSDIKLKFYVFNVTDRDTLKVSLELVIEESSLEHQEVDGKIVEYSKENYEIVSAAVNKYLAEEGAGKNRFIYPFFVRYALRLYDGSNVKLSPPVLMLPNSDYVPLIHYKETKPKLSLRAFAAELEWGIDNSEELKQWKGVIEGIDIYVSESAWPYALKEYSATESNFSYRSYTSIDSYGILKAENGGLSAQVSMKAGLRQLCDRYQSPYSEFSQTPTVLEVGKKTEEEYMGAIAGLSTFYRVASIDFEELVETGEYQRKTLEMKTKTLVNLAVLPRLDAEDGEGTLAYRGMSGGKLYGYNNRLHIYDGRIRFPEPIYIGQTNGEGRDIECDGDYEDLETTVWLHTDEGDKVVQTYMPASFDGLTEGGNLNWYYYPDSRAYKMRVIKDTSGGSGDPLEMRRIIFKLKPHDKLNGAYALVEHFGEDLGGGWFKCQPDDMGASGDDTLDAARNIYVSEVNNPFVFHAAKTVSIGGRVRALASATEALSQGQFGQFPLYAFTDAGIWAMEVGAEGSYSVRQPISRQVIEGRENVCNLERSVLFTTNSGAMELRGSSVRKISEMLGRRVSEFKLNGLPGIDKLMQPATSNAATSGAHEQKLCNCRMVYDSENSLVYFTVPKRGFSYVLNTRSGLWTQAMLGFERAINGYPESLAITGGGDVIRFGGSLNSDAEKIEAVIVSRPIKFGDGTELKTIRQLRVLGNLEPGHTKEILWGSRDLKKWHIIGTSDRGEIRGISGSGWRFFVVGIKVKLGANESIEAIEARVVAKGDR